MNNEPVTYLKKDESTGLYYECDKEYGFAVYTHPVKEQLTDEDLEIITEALLMVGFMHDFVNYDLKEKALAILRKASEK